MSVGAMGVFDRRLLLAVDARGYGSADTARQREIQTVLPRLLSESAEAAGLDRASWVRQAAGDSEFAVLPAGSDEQALVEPFMRRLDAGLRAHNRDRVPGARLALRAAVHFGPASEAPNGFVGPGPVEVSRILESDPLRRALAAAPDAALAVALTAPVFTELVAQGYTNFRPEEFREVVVEKKEYRGRAWLWVSGYDVHTLDLGDSVTGSRSASDSGSGSGDGSGDGSGSSDSSGSRTDSGSASGSGSGSAAAGAGGGDSVTTNLHGTVFNGNVVFGISK
ncbi:hypothetical protein Snoj_80060 [Streptomyces nojiriensis]|uniref:Guanylate cyclase domain-containing protein n=1 Tax=Streptomyces nojiriensis TaxID=66374 RepID=A0ABQ3T119_9ACTN|nr:hypothetical protein [Streptomyces nojiriensis]QTI47588.1 hypothetical protein JYK04_05437 [Streptomyces nojiriensis]GGR76969.1 hypothetical protein GCM10010205_02250 [Streptomyces nojiriensis]GHI74088.1 hypothetical protein Snoj_80060 [Streptomyces nojiriensis]